MTRLILFTFLLFMIISLNAQQKIDVLILKNGSIVRGTIIEINDENIKILSAGNLLVFNKDEIDKKDFEVEHESNYTASKKGYFNITSMGVLIGSKANEKVAPVSVLMEHNFRLSDNIAMGGVFGFEMLNETVCPVAINLKTCIPSGSGDYIIGITGGYSFSTEDISDNYYTDNFEGKGGKLINIEMGYLSRISKYAGVYFALGYRYNELNYKIENWMYNNVDRKMFFHRISFRMGISIF